jgi:hypothetical protein
MEFIKRKIDLWLGITALRNEVAELNNQLFIANKRYARMESTWEQATKEIVDVGLREGNTSVVVASNLGSGVCRWYSLNFKDIKELNDFRAMLVMNDVRSNQPFIDCDRAGRAIIEDDWARRGLNK